MMKAWYCHFWLAMNLPALILQRIIYTHESNPGLEKSWLSCEPKYQHPKVYFKTVVWTPYTPKSPQVLLISLYMTLPRGLLGSQRGGPRPLQLCPYESGDARGPPPLCMSMKEGGHRPPEPSCSKNCKNCCHSFNCGQIKLEGIFRVFRGLYWKFWNDSLKQNIHILL